MQIVCKLAYRVLASIKWLWLIPITTFIATYVANVAPTPWKDFAKGFPASVLGWYFLGPYRIYIYVALGLLIALPFVAWIVKSRFNCDENNEEIEGHATAIARRNKGDTAIFQNSPGNPFIVQRNRDTTIIVQSTAQEAHFKEGKSNSDSDKELKKYLNLVIAAHEGLHLSGIYQLQALIDVNVPLDDIFIHLLAASDRPIYEVPREQTGLLEELYQRTDLSDNEREELIHRLHITWHSQREQEVISTSRESAITGRSQELDSNFSEFFEALFGRSKEIAFEEVLQSLKPTKPVAILLGDPGSGKSTSLRWLALHMARASLSSSYHLPAELSAKQLPILLRISDYANYLSSVPNLSFHQFFKKHLIDTYPDLPHLANRLLEELKKGHCLLLIDGLDEVANNSLRRHIVDAIQQFITSYSRDYITEQLTMSGAYPFNRYIITSRIIGYEAGSFAQYAHYTLLDLKDAQITNFLNEWCRAVERYRAMSVRGMLPLTPQEEAYANAAGDAHRDQLLNALSGNPGIKRLAVNPLMLTILALIQRSGKTLPNRRIELYQTISLTLLHNWNLDTGRQAFQSDDIPLAEQLLSDLAYRLHSSDPVLTEGDVKEIAYNAMTEFYGLTPSQSDIQRFITVLRSSSGLFVESGLGLFNFMHRTFQEYYVARYLLRLPSDDLRQFAIEHFSNPIWHEPLLLVAAYKSGQDSYYERDQVNKLIRSILDTDKTYDAILQRNTLFAANCLVDCSVWSINRNLQRDIANRLFDLYGHPFGSGRYIQVQQEIERLSLLWLQGQPKESSQRNANPPLLDAWRSALCDTNTPVRQEGAVSLLAALAPDLPSCPKAVLLTLLPPLLQLANLHDLSYLQEIISQSTESIALPTSHIIEEYANVALSLLETTGPASWLHNAWLKWIEKQPKLAEYLVHHALEIDYLLTPAALPGESERPWNSSQWGIQFHISENWRKLGQRDPLDLQMQLLHASNRARFPQAYLFKQMLDREKNTLSTISIDQHWHSIWESFLQQEMENAHNTTYLACLNMKLLLCQGNLPQQKKVVSEFLTDLIPKNQQEAQALTAISIIYLLDMQYLHTTLEIKDFQYPQEIDYGQYVRCLQYINNQLDIRHLRENRGQIYGLKARLIPCIFYLPDIRYVRSMKYLLEMRDMCDIYYIRNLLDQDLVVEILCDNLKQTEDPLLPSLLFSLYCVLAAYNTIPSSIKQLVKESFRKFEQQAKSPTQECRLLITAILQQIDHATSLSNIPVPSPMLEPPDTRATILYALMDQVKRQITRLQIEEILAACVDERPLSQNVQRQYMSKYKTVSDIAWSLLNQQFNLDSDAQQAVLKALDHDEARVCAAGALMLQRRQVFPRDVQIEAARKIMDIMASEKLVPRPLEIKYGIQRLEEVLFTTLKVLAE